MTNVLSTYPATSAHNRAQGPTGGLAVVPTPRPPTCYIVPVLGSRKLDKLTVREVRTWLNGLRNTCQCCAQGKDKRRAAPKCCAAGQCCRQFASERTIRDAWTVLRASLNNAVRDGKAG